MFDRTGEAQNDRAHVRDKNEHIHSLFLQEG